MAAVPSPELEVTPGSSLDEVLTRGLDEWRARGLERTLRPAWDRAGATVRTEHGAAVDFSSNDYLGLASDARVARAARDAIERHGVGAAASRLIVGDHPEHTALERALAAFFGAPAALLFSSGYAANIGALPALVSRGDAIFADALNHASVIDGCRLSRAAIHVYPHGDVDALEALLRRERPAFRRALLVTDGVFSMDGDRAPLVELTGLAREYDCWTYVDDAHGAGVIGPSGRGTAEAAGAPARADITVGTLGKAFGAAGAFVYGSRALRDHLLNHARTCVFSTAMPPAQAAAAREAVRIVAAEPALRARLRANAAGLRAALARARLDPMGEATAHVVPLIVGDADGTMRVGAALRESGYLVGTIRPPTVPAGTSRLRLTASAAHTPDHIAGCVAALAAAIARG
ncbi:MAG TPA: 8-amino-7-oxononanoate synthase [Gemmatimonadaceae bacterium]|nr:8-amino-7-oxononanoate synthase [Gemmatimonadaceae bacterium]